MNKSAKGIILLFVFIFVITSYFLLNNHYEKHRYDLNKNSLRRTTDYSSVLCGCFESKKWDALPLSDNFRNKYKTKFDITENAKSFVMYENGYKTENGEELIIIGYLKEFLFDFDDSKGYRVNMYFRYKTTENGLLDDVEFVKMEKLDKTTGKLIVD